MSQTEKPQGDLPDFVRESGRPIIVYQAPPPVLESNATSIYLLAWLGAITVFLAVIAYCGWVLWNPARDSAVASPLNAEGRAVGLLQRIDERRAINAETEGLGAFLDAVRYDTLNARATAASHPLITGRGGVDALREEWDAMCQAIRAANYERRIGQIDIQIAELRRRRGLGPPADVLAQLDADIATLEARRARDLELRRTDGDDSLRCTPAALAPACSPTSVEAWCDPRKTAPDEFAPRDQAPS